MLNRKGQHRGSTAERSKFRVSEGRTRSTLCPDGKVRLFVADACLKLLPGSDKIQLMISRVQVTKIDMSATSTARTIWRGDQAHAIKTQAARLVGPLQQRQIMEALCSLEASTIQKLFSTPVPGCVATTNFRNSTISKLPKRPDY